ncbi:ribosome-associated translation inhibitor RaiA [Rickettsiales endosymbiont of Peranema trichophorum]|uniref:ribosome hibernation-promoting factor, HPF/YfiA family n=1 Tax=Rickettsiales endosymbiont of Peranema trichophorum TaxID=2486577 RepID=UPI001023156C|nr:ribosome-associated translation inhibitor RaiA [Rickettsiales endosymbiont of Peranema trichophorum]RZI45385.1 ribosome-associated translation inhibitor RaiA [Rickettsiales endosymbiont of Peranema trichophorum]
MQITVSGKHINVGEALRQHIEDSLQKYIKKYFENAIYAHVTISKEAHLFETKIIVNDGTGHKTIIKGSAQEFDAYKSVDTAIIKIEKQLRRYKRKISNHHHKQKVQQFDDLSATRYIISPVPSDFIDEEEEQMDTTSGPLIVAEKPAAVEVLSVGDAVMKMDLLDMPALLFINAGSNKLNLVYHRKDGNIAWLDTNIAAS